MSIHDDVEINPPIDTWPWGSALNGALDLSYYDLVEALGEPESGDGYKVDAEWRIRWSDGMIATVYNYKSGHNYYGDEGTNTDRIRDWHVGGTARYGTPESLALVTRVLDLVTSRLDQPLLDPGEEPDVSEPSTGGDL